MSPFFHLIFLFLITLASTAYANENCANCNDPDTTLIVDTNNLRPLFESEKTECPPLDTLMLEEAKKEYKELFPDSGNPKKEIQKTILNQNICGSLEEINIFEKLVQDYGETPPEAWRQCPKVKSCIQLQCALTQIAGGDEETGLRYMNLAKRENYIPLFLNSSDEKSFSLREIRVIDETIKNLPDEFKRLPALKTLKRSRKNNPREAAHAYLNVETTSITDPNTGKITYQQKVLSGGICFFERSFTHSDDWLRHTIIHEMSHHLDFKGLFSDIGRYQSESSGFMQIAGWEVVEEKIEIIEGQRTVVKNVSRNPNAAVVSNYATTHPKEDFAETITEYILNPKRLKEIDPRRYDFIKNKFFSGKEFHPQSSPLKTKVLNELVQRRAKASTLECIKLLSSYQTHMIEVFREKKEQSVSYNRFNLQSNKPSSELSRLMVESPAQCVKPIAYPKEFESHYEFCRYKDQWIKEANRIWQQDILDFYSKVAIEYKRILDACRANPNHHPKYCKQTKDFLWDQVKKSPKGFLGESEIKEIVEVLYEKIK